MVQRIGGMRRNTRFKLRKNEKLHGKIRIGDFLQTFSEGDIVVLKAEPAYQKGMYYPRFHGKSGIVMGMKGRCYEVLIKDHAKDKLLVVHPVHLKKA